ncbi:MAG: serpin family protein [Lawsonibacter sp.]|nr:serpin family protein [Lawsonibacter sp.]
MKQLLAALLAATLSLTPIGCSSGGTGTSSGGSGSPSLSQLALKEPVYPEFPTLPTPPADGGNWDAYFQAEETYRAALQTLRGDGISQDTAASLTGFASRSTALALAEQAGKNAVYSPLSLWAALSMLAQCSGGDSRRQVLSALGSDSVEALQTQISQVWQGLYTDDGASSLLLANSVWLNSSLDGAYVPDTLDILANRYYAGTYAAPMGTKSADQAVTDWIGKQTNGLIGGGDPVVQTKAETLALLVSSLYYRAGWADEFLPELTKPDTFTNADRTQIKTDFMHQTVKANFLERNHYQAAALTTQLGEVVFLLPDQGTSPEDLLRDPELLSSLDFSGNDVQRGEVQWAVPKFDVSSILDLNAPLAALGVTDLLNPDKADLSNLTTLGAYLSEAKQLARVKADEQGVEGAAVTILAMDITSALPETPSKVCVMDLDRPFLFVIRTDGIPLFVGVVNQLES